MSDLAISALPQAVLPLTGGELVPLVQAGITVQALASAVGSSSFFTGSVSATLASTQTAYSPPGWGPTKNCLLLLPASGNSIIVSLSNAGFSNLYPAVIFNTSSGSDYIVLPWARDVAIAAGVGILILNIIGRGWVTIS